MWESFFICAGEFEAKVGCGSIKSPVVICSDAVAVPKPTGFGYGAAPTSGTHFPMYSYSKYFAVYY